MEIHQLLRNMRPGTKSISGGFIRNLCNEIVGKSLASGRVRNRKDAKNKVRIKASYLQGEIIRKQKI